MKSFVPKLGKIPLIHKLAVGGVGVMAIVIFAARKFSLTVALVVLLGILVVVGLWFCLNLIIKWREKKKGDAFGEELSQSERESTVSKTEVRRALDELGQRWVAAVEELRKSGLSLYSMPWYLLIGEPQSGKSTTLKNSGLEFPVGTDALSGAGGTRNCDWWFTDEAVVLDTAGRFSFQEKNAPDQQEWQSFLGLLRKHRGYCPINGVIVVVPCTSLLGDTPEQIEEKALNIRNKLSEIQRDLEIRFPVFLLVTKCDIILGFTEFFTNLDAAERRQILGWSNPGPFDQPVDRKKFPGVFDGLCSKVHQWRMRFLLDEISAREVDKLFVFPEEFGSLKEPLQQYVDSMFTQTRYTQPLFFRGIYFTSGLQQGRPIARACAELLRARGGATEDVVENLEEMFQTSRAFFIRDFYREKIFAEQGLVVRSESALKRDRLIRRLVWLGGSAIAAASIVLLTSGLISLYRALGNAEDDVKRAKDMLDQREVAISEAAVLAGRIRRSGESIPRVWGFRLNPAKPVESLKNIHSALYGAKCLVPLISKSERELAKGTTVERTSEFNEALKEYLRWWVAARDGQDFSRLSVEPFVRLLQPDLATQEDLIGEFTEFVGEVGDPTEALGEKGFETALLPALDSYRQQWDIRPATQWWAGLLDYVEEADRAYRRILELRDQDLERSEDVVRSFRMQAELFGEQIQRTKEHVQQLSENPTLAKAARTQQELTTDAERSYDGLIELAREGPEPEIARLVDKLEDQKADILASIEEDYQRVVGDPLKQYSHILKVDVFIDEASPENRELTIQLTQDATDVARALDSVKAFVEDDSSLRGLARIPRAIEESRSLLLFQDWHRDSESTTKDVLSRREMDDLAEADLHNNWNIDAFRGVMQLLTKAAVVERDVEFLELYIKKLKSYYAELNGELTLQSCADTIEDGVKVRDRTEEWVHGKRGDDLRGELQDVQRDYLQKVFDRQWAAIVNKHEGNLKGKFPFQETLQCGEMSHISDFLDELDELKKDCQPYEKSYGLLSAKDDRTGFVQDCEKLKMFLFDDRGRERAHKIDKIEIARGEIGQHYTVLRLTAPKGIELTFRPAGRETIHKDIEWEPGSANDWLKVEASVERRDGKSKPVQICQGSLSLLAFVVSGGKTDDGRQWNVRFEIDHPTDEGSKVGGSFVFEFDEKLPELPDWAMTR